MIITNCQLTCPECGHVSVEEMPTDRCMYFHECEACHSLLKPKAGDCGVYCSYGSVKCPPIQEGGGYCVTSSSHPRQ